MRKIRYIWRQLSNPDRTTPDNSQVVGQLNTRTQIDKFISRATPNRTGRFEDRKPRSQTTNADCTCQAGDLPVPRNSASIHTHNGVQMEGTNVAQPVLGPTRCSKIDGITHQQVLLRVSTPPKVEEQVLLNQHPHLSAHCNGLKGHYASRRYPRDWQQHCSQSQHSNAVLDAP